MRKKAHHEATEAIEFLSAVHDAFRQEQNVYESFIQLMREVRGGAHIPNHMLIERVQALFRGRPELVNGFLRFFDNTPTTETAQTEPRTGSTEERTCEHFKIKEVKSVPSETLKEFLVRFLDEKRMICVPPDCTAEQFKNLAIGSLQLLPQDFQVLYKGKPYNDRTVLNFDDKAEVEVKEKQTYMVDFARDVLDTTRNSFQNSGCFHLYLDFLKRLCQFAESTRNAEDLAQINSVVKKLFAQAGILNELLDYLPSLIYAHPHIRLYELQRENMAGGPKRRPKHGDRKPKPRHAQRKRKARNDQSYRRKRRRKDVTLPPRPKLKTAIECIKALFPKGLPFSKAALTSHQMKEFQNIMVFYWYGVLKLEETLKLCDPIFSGNTACIDAYKKLESVLETSRGHHANSKYREYYSIILSDERSKGLPLVQGQISYRKLPETMPLPTGAGYSNFTKNVLNDKHLSRAANYNDKSDQNERLMRKARSNENEDRVLQVDEERYVADMHIDSATGVIQKLRKMKEHAEAHLDEKISISDWLNQEALFFLKKLYGDKLPLIMNLFQQNCLGVIPILENRVEAKREEWIQYKQLTESHWHSTVEANHYSSLDVLGAEYRLNLKHAMRPKHLWEELRKDGNSLDQLINEGVVIDEYQKVRTFTETTFIVATLSNCTVNEPGLLGWKVDPTSEDWQHFAALFHIASGSCNYDSYQLNRFCRLVLKDIFNVNTDALSKFDHIAVEQEHKFNWDRQLDDIIEAQKVKEKSLLALFPKSSEITIVEMMTLAYKQDASCLMYLSEPLYCFLRYILLFHARLQELRWFMERAKEANPDQKVVYNVSTLVSTLSDALRDSSEVGIFEEEIALSFGPQAFRITSLYKLMQDVVKLAQNVSNDVVSKKLLILGKAHVAKVRTCRIKSEFDDWMSQYQTLAWEAAKKPADNFVCLQNDGKYISFELIDVDLAEEVYLDEETKEIEI